MVLSLWLLTTSTKLNQIHPSPLLYVHLFFMISNTIFKYVSHYLIKTSAFFNFTVVTFTWKQPNKIYYYFAVVTEGMGFALTTLYSWYAWYSSCLYIKDPELVDITPKVGPRSGGTTICIKGEDMDAGSDVTVMIDGGLCQVLK